MDDQAQIADQKKIKRRVGRSPAYPSFPVDKAIEYAQRLREEEGDYSAPLPSATKAWGYSVKSSGARQVLATLKYYGLIDVEGEGDKRQVKVSDTARRILLDEREDDSEKRALIRRVALTPSAHKLLNEKYPTGLPSDNTVTHTLVLDHGFSQEAAKELLAEYKRTADICDLFQPQRALDKPGEIGDSGVDEEELPQVTVGDKIQWTLGGVDQFKAPATVLGLSEDGLWVFTDAGDAAASIKEITVIEHPIATEAEARTPPPIPPHIREAQERLRRGAAGEHDATDGQNVLSRGKLKSGSFEVRVTGDIGAKEIAKIIKVLEAQRLILSDDEEDD